MLIALPRFEETHMTVMCRVELGHSRSGTNNILILVINKPLRMNLFSTPCLMAHNQSMQLSSSVALALFFFSFFFHL